MKPAPESTPVTRSVRGGFVWKSTDGRIGKSYPNSPTLTCVNSRLVQTRSHRPLYIQPGLYWASVDSFGRVAERPRSGFAFFCHW